MSAKNIPLGMCGGFLRTVTAPESLRHRGTGTCTPRVHETRVLAHGPLGNDPSAHFHSERKDSLPFHFWLFLRTGQHSPDVFMYITFNLYCPLRLFEEEMV